MSVRPTKTLAGLVIGALALFGVGTNVQAGWVLAIAALLGGMAVVGSILPFRALRGLDAVRRAPSRLRAGDPGWVTVEVRSAARGLRGPLLVRDRFLGDGVAAVPLLRPGEARSFSSRRQGARRGIHTSGVLEMWTGTPFGVVLVRRTLDVASRTVVHPRVRDVRLSAMLGRTAQPARSAEGDVSSVREYRSGDPLRLVHWRSTARRGELVVREFEEHGRGRLVVAAGMGTDPDVGDAVASLACSFALAGLREGYEVALADAGQTRRVASAEAVLDWGAGLMTGSAGSLPSEHPADALVCVVEPGSDTGGLVHRAARAARSGIDVVVVLVGRDEPSTSLRTAGAALRASGARVVTVDQDEDPLECSLELAAS